MNEPNRADGTYVPTLEAAGEPAAKPQRIVSLDALRAIVVAAMIFMDHPLRLKDLPWWLIHPDWNGFRIADWVFPAFVFIAGISLAYATRRPEASHTRQATATFVRRSATLFGIGIALNLIKYWPLVRPMGVLQRIAAGSVIAWPFRRFHWRWAVVAAVVLMAAHSAVLLLVGAPGVPAGSLGPEANIAGWIDTRVFGLSHTYRGTGFDPEGLLGILTTGAQVLLGLAVGKVMVAAEKKPAGALAGLAAAGAAAVVGAVALSALGLPINKPLWTASFVLISSGTTTLAFAALYWLADLKGLRKSVGWLVPMGRNALLVYIGSTALVALAMRVMVTTPGGNKLGVFYAAAAFLPRVLGGRPALASVLVSAAEVVFWFAVSVWLYRRKIFLKL